MKIHPGPSSRTILAIVALLALSGVGAMVWHRALRATPLFPAYHVATRHEGAIYVVEARIPIDPKSGEEDDRTVIYRFVPPDRMEVVRRDRPGLPLLGAGFEAVPEGLLIFGQFRVSFDEPGEEEPPGALLVPYHGRKGVRSVTSIPLRALAGTLKTGGGILHCGGLAPDGAQSNEIHLIRDDLSVEKLPEPPWRPRQAPSLVSFQDAIWLFGGDAPNSSPSRSLRDVWRSPDGGRTWERRSDSPWSPRSGPAILGFQGRLWCYGGYSVESSEFLNDVWRSSDGENWELVEATLPWASRVGYALVAASDAIYCIGGHVPENEGREKQDVPVVFRSTDGFEWKSIDPRP